MPGSPDWVLTAAQMRSAEQALIDAGTAVDELMQRAADGAAEWVWRIAAGRSVTVLCGPGNNGGDGYVIAQVLRERGLPVTVVAAADPQTEAARTARTLYHGEVLAASATLHAPRQVQDDRVLVDCLFGTGLTRPLSDELFAMLTRLAASHRQCIAVDLPSGVASDSGAVLNEGLPTYALTIALGAWKWAHWMMPAAQLMGERRLVQIGIDAGAQRDFTTARLLTRPRLAAPAADAHKYTRGLVVVVAGAMPGAAVHAARAAEHGGAGYVKVLTGGRDLKLPDDLVVDARPLSEALADQRISAIVVGPGLGRDDRARETLQQVLCSECLAPTVVDADALHLIGPDVDWGPDGRTLVFTPHAGELAHLARAFSLPEYQPPFARKVHEAIELDWQTNATIVAKGPDTIVFNRDLGMLIAPSASSWLSVAGSGDVLAGLIASRLAGGSDTVTACAEALWLHGEAARLAGPAFTASELAGSIKAAYAATL